MDSTKKIYLYNAHGYGFGGRIDRPFQHVLDVHAGASLPTEGGYEVSRRENFRLNEAISYTAAHTVVYDRGVEHTRYGYGGSHRGACGLEATYNRRRADHHPHRQPFRKPADCGLPHSR